MYKLFYKLILSKIDPETVHALGLLFIKYFSFLFKTRIQNQQIDFFGHKLINRIGTAAGIDKNGEAIKGFFNLGFGFVEVGTVTLKPQQGNPKPRIFRIGNSQGIINRMGFPNNGAEKLLAKLRNFKKEAGQVIGVNIGRNKDGTEADYFELIKYFINDADYITINISSPNTQGLRDMQKEAELSNFLSKVKSTRESLPTKKPFFLKISPDVSKQDLSYIYNLLVENNIEGIIISNTTLWRPNANLANENEAGGLSGEFLKEKSLELLKEFNKLNKAGIVVISLGGVQTAHDYKERLQNGASFVQSYTGFIFEGLSFVSNLLK